MPFEKLREIPIPTKNNIIKIIGNVILFFLIFQYIEVLGVEKYVTKKNIYPNE